MFKIHTQLLNDCHHLGQIQKIHLLLHKNAALHWFILVPETSCTNFLELDPELLKSTLKTAQVVNKHLINDLGYQKTNFASIGNIVDQLHCHIVGRHSKDACWPQPVWGNLTKNGDYSDDDLAGIKTQLTEYFPLEKIPH